MGKQAVVLALLLCGCTTVSPVEDPRSVWCEHNEPRRPSSAVIEVMTKPELDALNSHNDKGVEWCGWKF
jgi:hypothetical protein